MKAARNVSQSKLGEAFRAPVPPPGLWGTTPRGPTLALSVSDTGALRQHFRGSASLSLIGEAFQTLVPQTKLRGANSLS